MRSIEIKLSGSLQSSPRANNHLRRTFGPKGRRASEGANVRSESCSCVVRSVAEVEWLRLASRKRKHRQKRRWRARVSRSMANAPLNWRCASRDRRDVGGRDCGGKTTACSQLARGDRKVLVGAALGLGPGSRESSVRWKAPWIVDAEEPSRAFARSGLGSVGRSLESHLRSGDSRRIDRGVRGSIEQAARGRKHLVISAGSIRLSPLSRRETRCGSVARPKG